jgi:hypothetical protein
MGSYTDGFLKRLRNDIDIDLVINRLRLERRDRQKNPQVPLSGLSRISYGDQSQDQPGQMF